MAAGYQRVRVWSVSSLVSLFTQEWIYVILLLFMLTLHFGLDDVGVSETSIFLFRINTFMIHGNYTVRFLCLIIPNHDRFLGEGREVKWYYWQWSLQILLSYCPIYISARSLSHHSDVATVVVLAIKKWWIQTSSNYKAAFGNENVREESEFSFPNAAQTRLVLVLMAVQNKTLQGFHITLGKCDFLWRVF